jgi:serine/threonine protein kinase
MTASLPTPRVAGDPRIGVVLSDRYRIVRKIGQGGLGSVYEAEHLLIKRRLAVKILHAQYAADPEIVARFHREAQAASAIGHPHIVEITDMGVLDEGAPYMVLEYLDGRDWRADLETQGAQPLGKTARILTQICDALSAAHAKGIIHRDLKPENIFLIPRGEDPDFVKVLDFGVSKFADSGEHKSLTQSGATLGTPYYMSPEQCRGRKDIDHRADIYALGVVLFRALTNHYPFDADSLPLLLLRISSDTPPPLSAYRSDLPEEVQSILDAMLAKEREERFDSCAALKTALSRFRAIDAAPALLADPPVPAEWKPAPAEPRPLAVSAVRNVRPSRKPFLAGLLLLLLAIAGGLSALLLWPRAEEHVPVPERTPVEPAPEAPRVAHVRITTVPADATLTLNGVPIPNPYEHDVEIDGRLHTIRAEREGYEPREIAGVDFSLQPVVPVTLQARNEPPPALAVEPEPPRVRVRPRPIVPEPQPPITRPSTPPRPVHTRSPGRFATPF